MKYTVKITVMHDGKVFEPGSVLDIGEETAAPLLAVGAVGAVEPAAEGGRKKDKGQDAPPAEGAQG